MRPYVRIPLLLASLTAAILSVGGCGSGGSPSSGSTNDAAGSALDGAALPAGVRAPLFTLPDQTGRAVSLAAQRGRVVALTFLWSDCRACRLIAQQIRGALDELPPAARPVTLFVSLDPRADTRARVTRFLRSAALIDRATYLSASDTRLRAVWSAYHLTTPAASGATAAEDSLTVLLIDRRGYERDAFGLEQITPEGLSHDLRALAAS